jgi:hypothetical protein
MTLGGNGSPEGGWMSQLLEAEGGDIFTKGLWIESGTELQGGICRCDASSVRSDGRLTEVEAI